MRRSLLLVAIWLLTAVGAVVLAWQGVSVVGDQVTDDRPPPLAASEIEAQLADTGPATSTSTTTTTTTTTPVSTTAPATTASSTPAGSETRTYNLRGGTASLRFSPEGVTVVFANPAAGFTVEVEPEHGNGVKVEFESDVHESRVDGWWAGGPVDRVQEEPDD